MAISESLRLTEQFLRMAASAQSERQQLVFASKLRRRLDLLLSLSAERLEGTLPGEEKDGPVVRVESVYQHVLGWKGAVYKRQLCVRAARRIPSWPDGLPSWNVLRRSFPR
ncbi:MAG: hypothetical protein QM713_17710 [Arachnia sp.]